MKKILICGVGTLWVICGIALADQGRIPVFQPVTISQPGSYVLTRDIPAASGIPVVIQASHVTLDLNGHAITGDGSVPELILIVGPVTDIRIENGRLTGGLQGLVLNPIGGAPVTGVSIHAVDFSGQGDRAVAIGNALSLEMTACSVTGVSSAVDLSSAGGLADPRASVRIVGNRFVQVSGDGLTIIGGRSILVVDNVFSEVGGRGMYVGGGSGALIANNVFSNSVWSGTYGILMANASGLVLDNTFRGMGTAVWVYASGSRIAGNLFVGPPAAAGGSPSAVTLGAVGNNADRILIELNKIDMHSGCGLRFSTTAHDNIFRLNTLRGSGGIAVCDNGTGNTDAGANVY